MESRKHTKFSFHDILYNWLLVFYKFYLINRHKKNHFYLFYFYSLLHIQFLRHNPGFASCAQFNRHFILTRFCNHQVF